MKIVEANFVGLEDEIWTKVAIKLDDGREGFLLFENEGRDVEVESESFDHSELFKGGVFDDMEILEGPIADGCRAYEEHFTRLEEIEAADAEAVAKLRLEAQPLETQRMPMLLNVVEQYQDYSDPDGFPNIFVLSDGTLVLCSEKRSVLSSRTGKSSRRLIRPAWTSRSNLHWTITTSRRRILARCRGSFTI